MLHPLEAKVRTFARVATALNMLNAVACVTCLVVSTIFCLGSLDYLLHLFLRVDDVGLRYASSSILVIVLLASCYVFLLPLAIHRWSDMQVARRVERFFPPLLDRLSSSLEFLKQSEDDATAGSPTLRRTVIAETMSLVEPFNVMDVLRLGRPLWTAAAALALCSLTGALLTYSPSAQLAGERLVMPWSSASWPRRNNLQFDQPVSRLAAGDDFDVTLIDINRRMPDAVDFQYRFQDDLRSLHKPMKPLGDKMVVRLDNVTRSLEYRATGGDDNSMPWYRLDVVEPPAVTDLQVQLYPPAYTGWPAAKSGGHIRALEGTRVEMTGKVNEQVKRVELNCEDSEKIDSIRARLTSDGRQFFLPANSQQPWVINQSAAYWLELTDPSGLVGGKMNRWQIHAISDMPPAVVLASPIGNTFVTPHALISLEAAVKDDIAIQSVELRYLRSDESAVGQQVISLYRGPDEPDTNTVASESAGANHSVAFAWDLAELEDLAPGQTIEMHVAASDYKPQTGLSTSRRLVLVSADELEDRLGQRQSLILSQLADALRIQRETRSQTESLETQVSGTGSLDSHDVDYLQSAELNQREVQRLLDSPQDGVQSQIINVLKDLEANRLDSPDVSQRLTQLLTQLGTISKTHLPAIHQEFGRALKDARAYLEVSSDQNSLSPVPYPSTVHPSLTKAVYQQDQIISVLEQLLGGLSEWDGFRRMAREFRRISRDQADMMNKTDTQRRDIIGKAIDDLSSSQKASLRILARQQLEISQRFDATASRLNQLGDDLAEADPIIAQTIADALDTARRQAISGQMRESGRDIDKNLLGRAAELQREAVEGLEEFLDVLANRREHELERLVDKLKEAAAELAEQQNQLESVRSGLKDADGGSDQQRRRNLERLVKQQEQLSEQVSRLARRLRRLQAEEAASAAHQAAENLRGSSEAAGQGTAAEALEQAASAAQQLDEAQQQIERSLRKAAEKLLQERLARILQQAKGLVARQQGLLDETKRLDRLRQAQAGFTKAQAVSAGRLARQQRGLATDVGLLAEGMADAQAFALALRGSVREMIRAARHLDRGRTDDEVQQRQQIALARLQQVLEALKMDDGQQSTDNGSSAGQPGEMLSVDMIQLLAQLKLLRLMQQEINRRTAELESTQSRRGGAWTDQQRAELNDLAAEQGSLADLILNLSQPSLPNPEDDPDRLPDIRNNGSFDDERKGVLEDAFVPGLKED